MRTGLACTINLLILMIKQRKTTINSALKHLPFLGFKKNYKPSKIELVFLLVISVNTCHYLAIFTFSTRTCPPLYKRCRLAYNRKFCSCRIFAGKEGNLCERSISLEESSLNQSNFLSLSGNRFR